MILAGDIGGTNSRLAVFDEKLEKVEEKIFKNAGRASLQEIILEFIKPLKEPIDREKSKGTRIIFVAFEEIIAGNDPRPL
jgi:predicted NBD/HSP70 family sugar kinase